MATKDSPKVYIPPPLFYVAFFLFSYQLQKECFLGISFLQSNSTQFIGWVFIFIGTGLALGALLQFLRTKNTIVTIKEANSLQTSGIYAYTRNPMYLSFFFIYGGLGIEIGNWWTFILMPFLALIMRLYVVKREERYLRRKFGKSYKEYKKQVRRWI